MNKDFEIFKQYIIDNYDTMIDYRKTKQKEYMITDDCITEIYIKLEDDNIIMYFQDEQESSADGYYRTLTSFDSRTFTGIKDFKECFLDDVKDCYGYDSIEEMLSDFNIDYNSDALNDTLSFIDRVIKDFNKYKLNYELNDNLAIKTDYKNRSISKV